MPSYTFKLEDGSSHTVGVPDGYTAEQAYHLLDQHLSNVKAQQDKDAAAYGSPARSGLENFAAGIGAGASRLVHGIAKLGDQIAPDISAVGGEASLSDDQLEQAKQQQAALAQKNAAEAAEAAKLNAPLMKTFGGKVGASVPIVAGAAVAPEGIIPGAIGAGGVAALEDPGQGGSRVTNAAVTTAEQALGGTVLKAIGTAVKPLTASLKEAVMDGVQVLKNHGIGLNQGQALGRPGIVPLTEAESDQQSRDLTRAALSYMGVGSDRASQPVMDAGKRVLQDTYDTIAARTAVNVDKPLDLALSQINADAHELLEPQEAAIITKQIANLRKASVDASGTQQPINGTMFQNIVNRINQLDRGGGKAPILADLDMQLKAAMVRSASPADAALLTATNQKYAAMKALQKAIGADDRIDPDKLFTALDSSANTEASVYGRGANAKLAQLAQGATLVLGNGAKAATNQMERLGNYLVARQIHAGSGALGAVEGYHRGGMTGALAGAALGLLGARGLDLIKRNPLARNAFANFLNKQSAQKAAGMATQQVGQQVNGQIPTEGGPDAGGIPQQ